MRLLLTSLLLVSFGCGDPGDIGGGGPCTDNSDCPSGFCGWQADNSRICKPWAQEGDSCLGFVTPEARAFCDPSLVCIQSDPTGDIPGVCTATCQGDNDCDTDSWCAPHTSGNDICKPWGQFGSPCGGFTPPEHLIRCDPSLFCWDHTPQLADDPGRCTSTCQSHGDCPSSYFCGADGNGNRLCKPRAILGESCGGFTLPQDYIICEVGLSCLGDPQIADAPGVCQQDCLLDVDCTNFGTSGGFCGFDEFSNRVCKPWGQIGDDCEGFVAPEDYVRCHPATVCRFTDPTIPDLGGTCEI